MGTYDTAQICRNGHVITSSATGYPQHRKDFCPKCGAPTITTCEPCGVSIQGAYHVPGFVDDDIEAPAHCHACGKPYPWTASAIDAARELADELEGLNAEERESLKGTLDDLVRDSARTPVASLRFKKLAAKTGKEGAGMLKDVLVGVVSEAARKAIWGG